MCGQKKMPSISTPLLEQQVEHAAVNALQGLQREQAPTDAGLVGDDRQLAAGAAQPQEPLRGPGRSST